MDFFTKTSGVEFRPQIDKEMSKKVQVKAFLSKKTNQETMTAKKKAFCHKRDTVNKAVQKSS